MRKPLPPSDIQLVNTDGVATPIFYELLQNIMQNLPTKKVKFADPTAGQTLKYNATTDQYEPG